MADYLMAALGGEGDGGLSEYLKLNTLSNRTRFYVVWCAFLHLSSEVTSGPLHGSERRDILGLFCHVAKHMPQPSHKARAQMVHWRNPILDPVA